MFKKALTFLEIIVVLILLGIFYSAFILKFDIKDNQLDIATNRLILWEPLKIPFKAPNFYFF